MLGLFGFHPMTRRTLRPRQGSPELPHSMTALQPRGWRRAPPFPAAVSRVPVSKSSAHEDQIIHALVDYNVGLSLFPGTEYCCCA